MALDAAIQQIKDQQPPPPTLIAGGDLGFAPPPAPDLKVASLTLPPLRSAPDPLSASSAGVPGAQITGTSIHINPVMADKVNQLIANAPPEIRSQLSAAVTSGERDMAQQEAAYRNYQGGGGLAAAPGHSQHQMWGGMALDWNGIESQSPAAKQYLLQNASKYGLEFPLGSQDPWHMQMTGQSAQSGGGQPNDTDHRRPPSPYTTTPAPPPSGDLQTFGQIAAAKYGVPWNIFYWAIQGESSWNPNIGPSSANAQGIAQLIPETAATYGVDVNNPKSSLDGAARYLATLYKQSGSWTGALTGYLTGDPNRLPPLDVIEQNPAYRTAYANAGFTTTDAIGQQGMETVQAGYRTKAAHADEAFRLAIEQINSSDKNLDRAMERIRAARDKADAAQDTALKAIQQQPKAPVLDGVQHMSSIAVIVGLLGGLMTKAPMLASTNAAAAAIEAYNAGDLRAFNIAHSLWKEQTDYLFKIADMQSQRVRDIAGDEKMGLDEKRAKLDATLRAMGLQEIADQARIDGPKAAMDWALQMQKYRDDHERYMQERDKPQPIYDDQERKWYNWYPLSNRKEPIPGTPQSAVIAQQRTRQDLTPEDRQQVERDLQAWLATDEGARASQTDIDNKRYDLGNELIRKKAGLKREEYGPSKNVQVIGDGGKILWPEQGGMASAKPRKDGKGWADESGNPLPQGRVVEQGSRGQQAGQAPELTYPDKWEGMPNKPPPGVRADIWSMALNYVSTGKLPPLGMGASPQRLQFEAAIPAAQHALGISPSEQGAAYIEYQARQRRATSIESAFGGGLVGRNMISLNTVADHLSLLQEYADALQNNDVPAMNSVLDRMATMSGAPEVINFALAGTIAGDEVVRLLTTTGGTREDRAGLQALLSPYGSPAQLNGAIKTASRFVASRYQPLEQQYVSGDPAHAQERRDFFNNWMVTPQARKLFDESRQGGGQGGTGGVGAGLTTYKTRDEVGKAYRDGKITYDQAKKILHDQFGDTE